MKIDNEKLSIAIAKERVTYKELCKKAGIADITFRKIRAGTRQAKPMTIGKIAFALNVDVKEIIAEE